MSYLADRVEALAARRYVYEVLWMFSGQKPGDELLAALKGDLMAEAVSIATSGDEATLASFEGALSACGDASSAQRQFSAIFENPARHEAWPWESMHVTDEGSLFQECTVEARRAYAKHGFLPVRYLAEPDDHIAIELHFMAKLAAMSLEACEVGDDERLAGFLADQAAFLEEHLLRWVRLFAEAVEADSKAPLYAPLFAFAADFMEADRELLCLLAKPHEEEQR